MSKKMLKGKLGYVYGTCDYCGVSQRPLRRYKKEMVCFAPCYDIKLNQDISKKVIRQAEKEKDSFNDMVNTYRS
jgi:hypothetical protein